MSRSSVSLRVFSMPQIMDESVEGTFSGEVGNRVEGPSHLVLTSKVNLRTSQLTSNRQHPVSLLTSTVSSTPLAPRTPRVQCPLVAQLALCSFAPAATRVAHSRILYRCLSYCWLSVQRVCRCACAPPSPSHCAAPPHHHRVTLDVSCRRVCGAESRGYSARVQCERHKIESTESLRRGESALSPEYSARVQTAESAVRVYRIEGAESREYSASVQNREC